MEYKNIKQIHRIYFYIYIIKYIQYKLQTFAYDSLGRRTMLTMPNGTTTSYSYDNLSRLLQLQTLKPNLEVINNNTYTYDSVGNKLTKQDSAGTHNYTYDNTYQLIQSTLPNETFAYDAVGNRNNTIVDAANKLLQDSNATYQYDNNGNRYIKTQTDGTITYYSYDYEGRLTRVETQKPGLTTIAVYKYDPLGRRIEKNVDGTITKYLYDNEDIIAEYDSNGNITTKYIHGLGIDEPLSMEKNGQQYYYHTDGLGSVTEITDSTGTTVQQYRYDSFGNIVYTQNPAFVQTFAFTGRIWDNDIKLYDYRARTYDSKTGTFTQKDPIGFKGGDVNLYRYVGNNPINFVDPLGLWRSPWKIFDEALKDAAYQFPSEKFPDAQHNGVGDAYRHCVASCEMTREDSSFVTSIFGWANEKKGDWFHNQELGEREMDDFNNAYGRKCGKYAKSTQACQQKCIGAVNSGKLKTYESGDTLGYWY